MKPLTTIRLVAFSVACLVMLIAGVALAQVDPLPAPAAVNPNPAAVVTWCGFGYLVLSGIVAALKPENPFLPFSIPTSARVTIAAMGAASLIPLQAIVSGVPWLQAVGAALVTFLSIVMKHASSPTTSTATPADVTLK